MAFTVTRNITSVYGNKRVNGFLVTADAASGVIDSGLAVVEAMTFSPVSMSTAAIKLKINTNAASAAANGQVMVSSATSGDVFQVMCHGR